MQDVALSWTIHSRLGDPVYLGLRVFASDAPLLAFMLVGGAVADRIDRRGILIASNLLQMTFAAVLGLLYATGRLGIVPILAMAVLTGLAQSQSAPTYQAVLTSLVPARQIPGAVALNSLQFNLSRFIGPMVAGALLAQGGAGLCFGVNVLSFVAVIVAVAGIELPATAGSSGEGFRQSLRAGFAQVRGSAVLSSLVLLGGVGSLLAFPLITYLPVLAGDVLRTGASGYSLLLSSYGAGAIAGALTTAHRGQVAGRGRLSLMAFAAHGLAALLAVLSGRQWLAMALLFLAGMCLVVAFSIVNSLVQEHAPEAYRGRILSIYGLAFRGGAPVGSLLTGVGVRALGAPATLGALAACLMAFAGLVYLRRHDLRAL